MPAADFRPSVFAFALHYPAAAPRRPAATWAKTPQARVLLPMNERRGNAWRADFRVVLVERIRVLIRHGEGGFYSSALVSHPRRA